MISATLYNLPHLGCLFIPKWSINKQKHFIEICMPVESSGSDNEQDAFIFTIRDDHERNYKPVNDICFSLILRLGYLTSYNILVKGIGCLRKAIFVYLK